MFAWMVSALTRFELTRQSCVVGISHGRSGIIYRLCWAVCGLGQDDLGTNMVLAQTAV